MMENHATLIRGGGRHPDKKRVLLQRANGQCIMMMRLFVFPCPAGVYLKQVGVLVFLAHVGSFIPCGR
jgi:hypothetical protein